MSIKNSLVHPLLPYRRYPYYYPRPFVGMYDYPTTVTILIIMTMGYLVTGIMIFTSIDCLVGNA